jgi:hypothetical protein
MVASAQPVTPDVNAPHDPPECPGWITEHGGTGNGAYSSILHSRGVDRAVNVGGKSPGARPGRPSPRPILSTGDHDQVKTR